MSNLLGYIASGIGIVAIAISTEAIRNSVPLLNYIPTNYLVIGGLSFVGIGVILLMTNNSRKQEKEVPIYDKHGKTIVGYRRMK